MVASIAFVFFFCFDDCKYFESYVMCACGTLLNKSFRAHNMVVLVLKCVVCLHGLVNGYVLLSFLFKIPIFPVQGFVFFFGCYDCDVL